MAGKFITFEGGDGSGKTTQVLRLAKMLREYGFDVVTTREPGGTPGADAIRHVVLSGAARDFGPNIEAVLFAAARADHLDKVIRPALEEGAIVICDRFHDSTRVYQAATKDLDLAFLDRLETATLDGVAPDLTIILDVPAELGYERAKARRSEAEADRFESDALDVHAERRERFLAIAEDEPDRCVVIDGRGEEEEIAEDIVAALEDRLGLKPEDEKAERASETVSG
ncbi:THYMIDYLATE KINASE [Fulvimarina pelagi HTCC2506]|uniref:Thymidylate kinase n=1 Tax=Fulvimarina pelagi HTCC2506 TaxID=314231 RepID=Q0G740_9HYPH|nr:dTMP kinase [Fulvimarina pelagi]EAU42524.1 THYMIDYLATE KINASE [Fulvimarina pelagi HTCC2506]